MSALTLINRVRDWLSPNGHATGEAERKEFFPPLLPGSAMLLPGTRINYAKEVGDGLGSSVLMPPLNWIMRNVSQAPPVVERLRKDEWSEVREHALTELLREPNPFYGGRELWMATALEFAFGGNVYWLKIRNAAGAVVQLWWIPSAMILPKWPTDGSVYVSHYEYQPGGRTIKVAVEDLVHLRHGLDPRNPRLGLAPLGAMVREVFTDDQAANFQSVILRNLGIIGVVIAPKERGLATKEDVEATKAYLLKHFTGDKRGEPLALGQPTDVHLLQYNLQGLDVSPLRDVAEERVCAALGIPAAVVGFGTGLQTTKVGATMREMRRMAWTDGVIPLQDVIAAQVGRQLLAEFEARPERVRVRFDLSAVPALMEDTNEKHARVRADYLAGVIKRAQAKRELGYPVETEDEVYAQPTNVVLLRPGEVPTQSAAPGGGDGTEPDDPKARAAPVNVNLTIPEGAVQVTVLPPDVHVPITVPPAEVRVEHHTHAPGAMLVEKQVTARDPAGRIDRTREIHRSVRE